MTIKKVTNFIFPVGSKALSQEANYRALSAAKSGFYPIGKNRLWHGGIHIDENVISELKVNSTEHMPEVKCIADGEIIAYRINDSYPLINYDEKVAFYSSGFVLIRHLLQMDYVELPLSIDNDFNVISGNDSMAKGINVRSFPGDKKIGFLSNGAEISVMLDKELIVSGYYWYPLVSITNNYSSVPKLTESEIKMPETSTEKTKQCLGWISLGKSKLTSATQTVADQTDDPTKNNALEKGLAVKASQSHKSDTLSLLPIGSKLKLSEFDTSQKWAKVASLFEGGYSSTPNIQGWVEVSHLQQLPVIPEKDKKVHQLYFYSLYMHLADIFHYEYYPKATIPSYFAKNNYEVTKEALDKVEGLYIRSEPLAGNDHDANILGVLQQGTKVKLHLNFREKDKTNWYAVASLSDGYHSLTQLSTQSYTLSDGKTSQTILGWIYLSSEPDKSGEYTIGNKEKDQSAKSMGLRIRKSSKNGTIVSMLPEGCIVSIQDKIDPKKPRYLKISPHNIEANKATLPLAKGDYFIWSASLAPKKEQQCYNQVIVLDEPLPVKAGELIGHIGHYHFANQAVKKVPIKQNIYLPISTIEPNIYLPISTIKPYQRKPLLHVELFTCDDLPNFIKKTQEEAKKIAEKDKPLLLIDKEAKLYRVSDDAEQLSIAENVNVEVIEGKGQKWLKVKERYLLTINASDYGYTLNDLNIKKPLNVDSKKHSQFITALNLQTTDELTTTDIPATIRFTGNYINPTTEVSTTDKAVATKAKSGYTDISVVLVRENKTIWVERSQLNHDGRRLSLSGQLTGWKNHPLTAPKTNDNLVVGYPKTIKLSDSSQFSEDEKATDESKNEWRYITVGSNKDIEIKGWVKTKQAHVKLVSPWEWSGFEQIEAEHSALAELRLSNIKAENEAKSQSKENATQVRAVGNAASAKPVKTDSDLITHLMSILKNLNHDDSDNPLTTENLKSALRKPWLAEQFGHILVKYESEWYAEIDGEGKMPKWEALNEQMSGEVQSYLDFLNDQQDKEAALAKLEQNHNLLFNNTKTAEYSQKMKEFLESLERLKRHSLNNTKKRESLNGFKAYLANNIELWEKEKQRIKTLLWWDEVAKKLAEKQAAQTKESEAAKADPQPLPSLSVDGKAWYLHPVAFIEHLKSNVGGQIIFPLKVKPKNDKNGIWKSYYWAIKGDPYGPGGSQALFGRKRNKGGRKHAARDLYTEPLTEIVAISDGEVKSITTYYHGTWQITIKHETKDGRKFFIKYCEVDPNSITVKNGAQVKQGDVIAKTGLLINPETKKHTGVISGEIVYMLHFEYYTGSEGFDTPPPNNTGGIVKPYDRRKDIHDPLDILQEGYKNTFENGSQIIESNGNRVDVSQLNISNKGKAFIKEWEVFSAKAYNDSKGFCTIGYGHLIEKKKCEDIILAEEFKDGITQQKADELFESRITNYVSGLRKSVTVKLYQYEFDALVSLLFTTGESGLDVTAPNLKKKLNNSDYKGAATEFLDITNGGTSGLVKRRNSENNLFLNNIYDASH